MRRVPVAIASLAVLASGCSGAAVDPRSSPAPASSASSAAADGADEQALECGNSIDGGPPPAGMQVVLGAVALPASPGSRALQAAASGGGAGMPGLFAKTGLLVRAGVEAEISVDAPAGERAGIGWGGAPSRPGRRFVVPACPDARGTGWLAFAGGYWVDRPLCLPLVVRAGGREQRVLIGVGRPCPGQQPPATP